MTIKVNHLFCITCTSFCMMMYQLMHAYNFAGSTILTLIKIVLANNFTYLHLCIMWSNIEGRCKGGFSVHCQHIVTLDDKQGKQTHVLDLHTYYYTANLIEILCSVFCWEKVTMITLFHLLIRYISLLVT